MIYFLLPSKFAVSLQVKLKGPKGRLALLKDENARFCAPKTRIPTPAPKKKPAVAAPDRSIFVSKIPSPKSSLPSLEGPKDSQVTKADVSSQQQQQHGASPQAQAPAFQFDMEAATPEDPVQGHCGLDEIASDALQLSEEIADHLAATPVAHPEMHMEGDELQALAISQEACVDCSTQTEPSSSPQVAGMGTPLDFTSVFNLDDFDSSTLLLGPQADSGTGLTSSCRDGSHAKEVCPAFSGVNLHAFYVLDTSHMCGCLHCHACCCSPLSCKRGE